jgi:hypothetical protein
MVVMDAENQFFRIFALELQLAGVDEAWARKTTAKLFAKVGGQDTSFFTWRKSGSIPIRRRQRRSGHP